MSGTNDNLRHWSVLGRTDPKHTKSFQRAGGFRGTATKPIWTEMRLTEHFGPCGVGWGFSEPQFQTVPAGEEILVFCTLRCWYKDNNAEAFVYGVGGDKVLAKNKNGSFSDDEAFKKAFTDALGNAFKHVGAGADVHMGLFEDSKYVAETRREFEGEDAPPQPARTEQSAQPPRADPDKAKGREIRDRLTTAIEGAKTPAIIQDILNVNSHDLEWLKGRFPATYDNIVSLANGRTSEMYGATG